MHWSRGEGNSKVLETPIFKVKIQVFKNQTKWVCRFQLRNFFPSMLRWKKNYDYIFFHAGRKLWIILSSKKIIKENLPSKQQIFKQKFDGFCCLVLTTTIVFTVQDSLHLIRSKSKVLVWGEHFLQGQLCTMLGFYVGLVRFFFPVNLASEDYS